MVAKYLVCDVFDGLATLEDGSVDLIITSPPFLALRSYLPADHPDKGKEIGSESTPAAFLDVMFRFTAELRRVLAPHGSICVELGDTYAGTHAEGRQDGTRTVGRANTGRVQDLALIQSWRGSGGPDWPLDKSKTLIPELYRIGLAYGINPLTGQESPAGKWRVRNVVTWARPNPPVGALGDKWRPATSDVVVACVSGKRFWDDLATRKPHQSEWSGVGMRRPEGMIVGGSGDQHRNGRGDGEPNGGGAPLLDYWEIPPTGYSGSHYAVFPPALVVPLVQAMAPPKVCRVCGEPSRRIVESTNMMLQGANYQDYKKDPSRGRLVPVAGNTKGRVQSADDSGKGVDHPGFVSVSETVGWSDCGHDSWRPALILDPFAGSGTTLLVATGYGHDAIGIDIDERNAELARERVGPFLFERVDLDGTPV